MDATSLIVGVFVGIAIALGLLMYSQRSGQKASPRALRRLAAGDSGDVLADVDTRMAHGYFDDAASLLSAAIESDPQRSDIKYKLLEVYFIWGKSDEFAAVARKYRSDLIETPEWAKVVTMGQQICPGQPEFTESQGGAA